MTLDEDLMEVEPIFRGSNGTFQFTHPSFQEVLTAKQFADEINSGRLSVRDAYEQFWSYEEDADLWGLPKDREWSALLPGWKNVLLHMVGVLDNYKVKELVDVVSENYFKAERKFNEKNYNPLLDDFFFVIKLMGHSKNSEKLKTNQIVDHLITKKEFLFCYDSSELIDVGSSLTMIGCDDAIHSLYEYVISQPFCKKRLDEYSLMKFFAAIEGEKTAVPFLLECIQDKNNPEISVYAIDILAEIQGEKAVPFLLEYIQGKSNPEDNIDSAIRALEEIQCEKAIKPLLQLLNDKFKPDWIYEQTYYETYGRIHSIHQKLKPQGYNPPIKRLAS